MRLLDTLHHLLKLEASSCIAMLIDAAPSDPPSRSVSLIFGCHLISSYQDTAKQFTQLRLQDDAIFKAIFLCAAGAVTLPASIHTAMCVQDASFAAIISARLMCMCNQSAAPEMEEVDEILGRM